MNKFLILITAKILISAYALHCSNALATETQKVSLDKKTTKKVQNTEIDLTKKEAIKDEQKNNLEKNITKPSSNKSDNKIIYPKNLNTFAIHGNIDSYYYHENQKPHFAVPAGAMLNQETGKAGGNVYDYSRDWGMKTASVLSINARIAESYGADIEIGLREAKDSIYNSNNFYNRGTAIFAKNSWGKLSAGYQDGAEVLMRLDATKIASAGADSDSTWYKTVNLEGEDGSLPFYLQPGLYSESLFKGSIYSFSNGIDKLPMKSNLYNQLPFRLSYYSPNLGGLKFGISYSPYYNDDLFTTTAVRTGTQSAASQHEIQTKSHMQAISQHNNEQTTSQIQPSEIKMVQQQTTKDLQIKPPTPALKLLNSDTVMAVNKGNANLIANLSYGLGINATLEGKGPYFYPLRAGDIATFDPTDQRIEGKKNFLILFNRDDIYNYLPIQINTLESLPKGSTFASVYSPTQVDSMITEIVNYTNTSVNNINKSIDGLEKSVTNANQSIGTLERSVTGIKQSISGLEQSVTNINQSIAGFDQSISGLEQSVTNINQSIGKLEDSMTNINQSMGGFDQSISSLENSVTNINQSIDALEQSVTNINQSIGGFDQSITELGQSIEQSIAHTDQSITQVNTHIDNINTSLITMIHDVNNKLDEFISSGSVSITKLFIGPNYEHIVSGGLSYEHDFNSINFKIAATGEIGTAKKIANFSIKQYDSYTRYNGLAAFNLGAKIEYRGLKIAGSYANLNKSGLLKSVYQWDDTSNSYIIDNKLAFTKQKSTYYWTAGAGYNYKKAYLSATYFSSKKQDDNILNDFSLGLQYNLKFNKISSFTPYIAWHHFSTELQTKPSSTTDDNKGDVILAGVKFSF